MSATQPPADFAAFRRDALAHGASEAVARDWAPDTVVPEHTHPFAARALVVAGRMWLTVDGLTRELGPGDRFELAADQPHSERYGAEGATYWVARR